MAKFIRDFINELSNQIRGKITTSRRSLHAPIRVSFQPESNTGSLKMKREILSIKGETNDFSETGISFVVDSIRLREYYLVGENRVLDAEIELPGGTVNAKIMGLRYQPVGEHLSVNQYLIGASILGMSSDDRQIYDDYLHRKVTQTRHGRAALDPSKT